MWLSGQQKRPVEQSEGQVGVITMNGGEMAALLDCERRGLQVYSPAGYRWTPKVGQRVLVIQGKGEIPCVAGARQDGDVPDAVTVEAKNLRLRGEQAALEGEGVTVKAGADAVVEAGADAVVEAENVRLNGQVYVRDETLEELIIRIVLMLLG